VAATYLYLAAVAVVLAAIDIDVHRLPNAIVLPSYLVGALLLVPATAAHGDRP
jgi:leader peptidase (prepilin peptidase)/N-methyltransferase